MLKNKVCVKNEGITQDIFEAMIAVARASGFEIEDQNDFGLNNYDLEYMLLSKDNRAMIDSSYGWVSRFGYKEITIEDWLFSLAPEWADRLVKSDGDYWYASKVYAKKIQGGERIVYRTGFDLHTIATRKQGQWAPKVGEKCLHGNYICTPLTTKQDIDGMVVVEIDGEYIIVENNNFSEIPKHTEQELLAHELYKLILADENDIDHIKTEPEFKSCLKIVESGRFK